MVECSRTSAVVEKQLGNRRIYKSIVRIWYRMRQPCAHLLEGKVVLQENISYQVRGHALAHRRTRTTWFLDVETYVHTDIANERN